ncbi:MAG TPA: toll/interleukin-1 receptor domain-containing protein [Bryobacteraceae bacterium]|nr:toll/interleukin-1 receptor domain-containing protein [Bryobacteraceae bacterium]
MADPRQLELVRRPEEWNRWRSNNPELLPDLTSVDLSGVDLTGINLCMAVLTNADLTEADLSKGLLARARLRGTNLRGANLREAVMPEADLVGADLTRASLVSAELIWTNLTGVRLHGADLRNTNLQGVNLSGAAINDAEFGGALLGYTVFAGTDLRQVKGLDTCRYLEPSILDYGTLARSGKLPLSFLRGCGLPDKLIDYLPSLVDDPIQFYSCFISYSTRDQDFADRLHADLQNNGVRCWFAPHNVQGGKKLHEQIDEAIRFYDKLLLILSEASMESEWVNTEIAKARKREISENRRMLFPVRLVDFERLRSWECFDVDTGKDSAREIREYYVPDFSSWKNHDAYQGEFAKLLRDLSSAQRLE